MHAHTGGSLGCPLVALNNACLPYIAICRRATTNGEGTSQHDASSAAEHHACTMPETPCKLNALTPYHYTQRCMVAALMAASGAPPLTARERTPQHARRAAAARQAEAIVRRLVVTRTCGMCATTPNQPKYLPCAKLHTTTMSLTKASSGRQELHTCHMRNGLLRTVQSCATMDCSMALKMRGTSHDQTRKSNSTLARQTTAASGCGMSQR